MKKFVTMHGHIQVKKGMIFLQNFAEKSKFCLNILFGIEAVTRTRVLPRICP